MVTKAAHIHFPACEEYAENIRLLGEEGWRIINTGSLTVDHMRNVKRLTKRQIFKVLERDPDKPTVLMTVHPEAASDEAPVKWQIKQVLEALDRYDLQVVVTAPGMDAHRDVIVASLKIAEVKRSGYLYVESLGYRHYHSLLPHCAFVIGNSSSGLIEVPYYCIPTINIGDRQKGRVRHESVIDVRGSADEIARGIELALSPDFRKRLKDMVYKFGDGHTAPRIVAALKRIDLSPDLLRKTLESKDS
jgi:UDP-hydrolysing UDP-N-acetyl-D-glucosamine 2-epimerase